MLSKIEKTHLREQLQDPDICADTFNYMVARYREDYPSMRAAMGELAQRIYETEGVAFTPDTLRRYAEGIINEPKLTNAMIIAKVILGPV